MKPEAISDKIIELLIKKGPLTGRELLENSRTDSLSLWRTCSLSEKISVNITGNRYLRLDRRVDGYARLSPSILREFLTYTIIGLPCDREKIKSRIESLHQHIKKVSRSKLELSKEIISGLAAAQKNYGEIREKAAFVIAGDIVYNMAHDELRPEPSTGQITRGSDLDIIIVTMGLPENIIKELDSAIYEKKYYLLRSPAYREEIDYIIKDVRKVEQQLRFDSFESMVASKILDEGMFIYGSMPLFMHMKELLHRYGIKEKLKKMEETALHEREKAISCLLNTSTNLNHEEYMNLFYTKEETEEIF